MTCTDALPAIIPRHVFAAFIFTPLLMMFAGWVNRYQLDVIEYLREENRLLKERLGDRPIHFTDAERRRLARKAKMLGRKVLNELETLVTPRYVDAVVQGIGSLQVGL